MNALLNQIKKKSGCLTLGLQLCVMEISQSFSFSANQLTMEVWLRKSLAKINCLFPKTNQVTNIVSQLKIILELLITSQITLLFPWLRLALVEIFTLQSVHAVRWQWLLKSSTEIKTATYWGFCILSNENNEISEQKLFRMQFYFVTEFKKWCYF